MQIQKKIFKFETEDERGVIERTDLDSYSERIFSFLDRFTYNNNTSEAIYLTRFYNPRGRSYEGTAYIDGKVFCLKLEGDMFYYLLKDKTYIDGQPIEKHPQCKKVRAGDL